MHGAVESLCKPLKPDTWHDTQKYLYGVDLFNHGYYWEAHEAWESLWHAAGRRGATAEFLKGLIKLAAAGVKAREGNSRGVERHARRAIELLNGAREQIDSTENYCGVRLAEVIDMASALATDADTCFLEPRPSLLLPDFIELTVRTC